MTSRASISSRHHPQISIVTNAAPAVRSSASTAATGRRSSATSSEKRDVPAASSTHSMPSSVRKVPMASRSHSSIAPRVSSTRRSLRIGKTTTISRQSSRGRGRRSARSSPEKSTCSWDRKTPSTSNLPSLASQRPCTTLVAMPGSTSCSGRPLVDLPRAGQPHFAHRTRGERRLRTLACARATRVDPRA